MNGDHNSRGSGQESDAPTTTHLPIDVEDLDRGDRELLAERLDALAVRAASDLRDLAAEVREGETPTEEDVEAARNDLRRADTTVRRHLGGVPETDDGEHDLATFAEVEDAERLREAPAEEVAQQLAVDVLSVRQVAERVDRGLYSEDLTDGDVGDLWDTAARVEAWARDVLTHRTDREVRNSGEDAERAEEGADHA